ncbi:MAG: hypothetical protein KAH97_10645 [Anaerolineales bacterium]|nr:hypothetical protein [Anaerolineales bacterium]
MTMKLLMTWDIIPGKEQEYFEFVVREFVPGMQGLGIQPTEAWYTTYGEHPQILTGGTTKDLDAMEDLLGSEQWNTLKDRLLEFVTNFDWKVVTASSGFQM